MDFNDLEWHDAIIKKINIDRAADRKKDTIEFQILWPDGQKNTFVFEQVYWANFNLGYGTIGHDSIITADVLPEDDPDLLKLHEDWKGALNNISLKVFVIYAESTFKIIAQSFSIK